MIKRGDVYLADLNPVIGAEQSGIRPVLIIQNNIGNAYSPTVIVLAITSKSKKNMPTHVKLDSNTCGLSKDSIVLVEQVRTLDKKRLIKKIGTLTNKKMLQVREALKLSLNIRADFNFIFDDW